MSTLHTNKYIFRNPRKKNIFGTLVLVLETFFGTTLETSCQSNFLEKPFHFILSLFNSMPVSTLRYRFPPHEHTRVLYFEHRAISISPHSRKLLLFLGSLYNFSKACGGKDDIFGQSLRAGIMPHLNYKQEPAA